VLDLGCGSGALLADLLRERRHAQIVGVDVSPHVLLLAERRLRLDRLPERQRDRVRLWQSALTYTDDRMVGFDAAVLMEVIEHVDPSRLPAVAASVFGHARPNRVILTTPNVEYNVRFPDMTSPLRHPDHRFEWTRTEFVAWCTNVGQRYGYRVEGRGVGEPDPQMGPPTQMAVFDREEPTSKRGTSEAGATRRVEEP
jgi:3' terminal RNA ribose 2'-O-methyltransferase Hen1